MRSQGGVEPPQSKVPAAQAPLNPGCADRLSAGARSRTSSLLGAHNTAPGVQRTIPAGVNHRGFLAGFCGFGFRRIWTGVSQQATTCRTIPPLWHAHSHRALFTPQPHVGSAPAEPGIVSGSNRTETPFQAERRTSCAPEDRHNLNAVGGSQKHPKSMRSGRW